MSRRPALTLSVAAVALAGTITSPSLADTAVTHFPAGPFPAGSPVGPAPPFSAAVMAGVRFTSPGRPTRTRRPASRPPT